MVRVLLIDDDETLTAPLAAALGSMGHQVVVAPDGAAGLNRAEDAEPEVVIVDLGLPDTDGVDLVRRIRGRSEVPQLALTGASDPARRVQAFDAGADDYLRKPFRLDELEARLRALARRPELRARPGTVEAGDLVVDLAAKRVTRTGGEVRVTPIEWRILAALTSMPGRLVTHRALLAAGWGEGHGDRETLRAHVRSLRAKLGDDAGAARYVRTEAGLGYRWIGGEEEPSARLDAAAAQTSSAPADAERTQLRHDLENALTALEVSAFVLGPAGQSAGVSEAARTSALRRLPDVATRVRDLVAELLPDQHR